MPGGTPADPHTEPMTGLFVDTNHGLLMLQSMAGMALQVNASFKMQVGVKGAARTVVQDILEGGPYKYLHDDGSIELAAEADMRN